MITQKTVSRILKTYVPGKFEILLNFKEPVTRLIASRELNKACELHFKYGSNFAAWALSHIRLSKKVANVSVLDSQHG
jgi:hypothetical protein